MSDSPSQRLSDLSSQCEQIKDVPVSSPPSTAASSAETISTNDEDAHCCDEWELFTNSRPPSEQESRSCTADSRQPLNSQNQLSDEDSDSSCASSEASDEDDNDDLQSENKETALESPHVDPADDCDQSMKSGDDSSDLGSMGGVVDTLVPNISQQTSARSNLSSSSSAWTSIPHSTSNRIQVYVRIRPRSRGETDANAVAQGEGPNSLRVISTSNGSICESTVDGVLDDRSTQEEAYGAVSRAIDATLEGMNATVFAYGQTGTGKTFTMFGDDADDIGNEGALTSAGVPEGWGLILRALWQLCRQARATDSRSRVQLSCSFLQIYNDRVFDLLADRKRQKPLVLREQPSTDGGTNVVLMGLSREIISSFPEALQVVRKGRTNRSVRETESNASSSRSHAIVQVNLSIETTLPNGDKRIRSSRLNLVDLAGSEKWNTEVDMEEHHAAELKNINSSLSALGNCIAALAENGRRHIPYRDSTLTRLLQDSFGGSALAFLIATVSPCQKASEETIRTLQFADRARSVMQLVRVNESFSGSSELLAAKAQIKSLREKLSFEQRRRHETRLKEHEAFQREFAAKLQEKDDELKKVRRDNEVFAKWREEDTKRIRALEMRLKEMESRYDINDGGATRGFQTKTSATSTANTAEMESNQSADDSPHLMYGNGSLDFGCKSLSKKKSIRAKKIQLPENGMPHGVNGRGQNTRVNSYRSLIDKYSHAKKVTSGDTHQPIPRGQVDHESVQKKDASFRERTDSSVTPPSTQKIMQLQRSTSDSSFASPTHESFAKEQPYSYMPDNPFAADRLSSDPLSNLSVFNQAGSLHKAESLPALGKVAHTSLSTLQHQSSSPRMAAIPSLVRGFAGAQAWQLPSVQSNTTMDASLARSQLPLAGVAQQVCVKHSLKGCVLCAVSDPPSGAPAVPSTFSSFKIPSALLPSTAAPSNSPPASEEPRSMCDRHQLPGCFICIKPTSEMPWRFPGPSPNVLATSTSTTSVVTLPHVDSPSMLRATQQDTKCSTHMLTNCVLCSGANTRAAPIPSPSLEACSSPTKRPQPDSTAWRNSQLVTIEPPPPSISSVDRAYVTSSTTSTTFPPARVDVVHGPQASHFSPSNTRHMKTDIESRKQFHSLLREASDAASIALRRRV